MVPSRFIRASRLSCASEIYALWLCFGCRVLSAAVERLIKDWYIDRHETNELYNSILSASADAEAKRHP